MREGMDVGKQREVERVFFRSWHLTILGWRVFIAPQGFYSPLVWYDIKAQKIEEGLSLLHVVISHARLNALYSFALKASSDAAFFASSSLPREKRFCNRLESLFSPFTLNPD